MDESSKGLMDPRAVLALLDSQNRDVRAGVALARQMDDEVVRRLLLDRDQLVLQSLAMNPFAPGWALERLAAGPGRVFDARLRSNPATPPDLLRRIESRPRSSPQPGEVPTQPTAGRYIALWIDGRWWPVDHVIGMWVPGGLTGDEARMLPPELITALAAPDIALVSAVLRDYRYSAAAFRFAVLAINERRRPSRHTPHPMASLLTPAQVVAVLSQPAAYPRVMRCVAGMFAPPPALGELVDHPDAAVRIGVALNQGAGGYLDVLLDDPDDAVSDTAIRRIEHALG